MSLTFAFEPISFEPFFAVAVVAFIDVGTYRILIA